jgi:ribosomal protein S11
MASQRLDLPSVCDICGFARSTRKHKGCSKLRQQRKAEEWAALMAEKTAARTAREKRYAR